MVASESAVCVFTHGVFFEKKIGVCVLLSEFVSGSGERTFIHTASQRVTYGVQCKLATTTA